MFHADDAGGEEWDGRLEDSQFEEDEEDWEDEDVEGEWEEEDEEEDWQDEEDRLLED